MLHRGYGVFVCEGQAFCSVNSNILNAKIVTLGGMQLSPHFFCVASMLMSSSPDKAGKVITRPRDHPSIEPKQPEFNIKLIDNSKSGVLDFRDRKSKFLSY